MNRIIRVPQLETDRLILRMWSKRDAEALFEQMKLLCEPYGTKVTLEEDGLMHFA